MNVTLLDGFFLQHFAGNFLEAGFDASFGSDLLGGFVDVEGELPAEDIDGRFFRGVRAFPGGFPYFGGDGVYVGAGYGRVYCADVDHATGLYAMEPDVAAYWRGVVKLKDEFAVGGLALFLFSQSVILSGVSNTGGGRWWKLLSRALPGAGGYGVLRLRSCFTL
jgi:hypothetical protein